MKNEKYALLSYVCLISKIYILNLNLEHELIFKGFFFSSKPTCYSNKVYLIVLIIIYILETNKSCITMTTFNIGNNNRVDIDNWSRTREATFDEKNDAL